MKQQQHELIPSVPAALNPAKRAAGQLMGRYVVVFGSGVLAPVARRWKTQINELAKTWQQFEILPEADHNTLEGILQPEGSLSNLLLLFLKVNLIIRETFCAAISPGSPLCWKG